MPDPHRSRRHLEADAKFDDVFVLRTNTDLDPLAAHSRALGRDASWPEIRADLHSLAVIEVVHDGQRFLAGAAPRPAASLAPRRRAAAARG